MHKKLFLSKPFQSHVNAENYSTAVCSQLRASLLSSMVLHVSFLRQGRSIDPPLKNRVSEVWGRGLNKYSLDKLTISIRYTHTHTHTHTNSEREGEREML